MKFFKIQSLSLLPFKKLHLFIEKISKFFEKNWENRKIFPVLGAYAPNPIFSSKNRFALVLLDGNYFSLTFL